MANTEWSDTLIREEMRKIMQEDKAKQATAEFWETYVYEPFNPNTHLRVRLPVRKY